MIALGVLSACVLLLMGMLFYQQWFYSKQIQALVERLMARSIQEFELAKNPPPPRQSVKFDPPMESFDRILG